MAGMSKMMSGTSLLMHDNTIPGTQFTKEFLDQVPIVIKTMRDFGFDFYEPILECCTYDSISEYAAYSGMPERYPHWQFGMEYTDLAKGYEYSKHRIYEMVINCLMPQAQVVSRRGSICASDVKTGDVVYAGNGPRNVVAVVRQPAAKTIKINLHGHGRPLGCSLDHRWKVMGESGPEWVKASDLKVGDLLIGGDTYDHFQGISPKIDWTIEETVENTHPRVRNRVKDIHPSCEMTYDLAEFIGICLGDGSIGTKGAENLITVCVDRLLPSYIDHVSRLANDVFDTNLYTDNNRESVVNIVICSKAAIDYFDSIGIPKGCTCKTKRIPWIMWASSNEYRASFLRGLFDTDGYTADTLGISCYNHEFACDIQLMLLEMGIYSVVYRRKNNDGEISVLTVQGRTSLFRFRDRIGFQLNYKNEGLSRLTDTENCVAGGFEVPYIQQRILDISKEYRFTTNTPLGASLKKMKEHPVGMNVLYGFVHRALVSGHDKFFEVFNHFSTPFFQVESIEEGPVTETIDIALDHNDHDFLVNGVESHNTDPTIIYFLDSNTLVDNVTVLAHALGHSDFFKNNIFFKPTNANMVNKMANHGVSIRRYMARWGKERVTEFIDTVLRIETLIDPVKGWSKKEYKNPIIKDKRTYKFPERKDAGDHEYMEEWLNPKSDQDRQWKKIRKKEAAEEIGAFAKPEKDVFGFLKDHAPLKPWQQDIIAMLYDEAMYFQPQRMTKVANEGLASWADSKVMADMGLISLGQPTSDCGIFEYAEHKMGVLGGKYSTNPYKLGYSLLSEIESRWDKGQFGKEWEECEDIQEKKKWDKKLGLGIKKVFEVRECYNDLTLIAEFFDQEFCDKYEYFDWKKFPNGETRIVSRDAKEIKQKLMRKHLNGGLPDIRITDDNHLGRGWLCLEHKWDGRMLYDPYCRDVMAAIYTLWQQPVVLSTKTRNGDEFIYVCESEDSEKVYIASRADYDEHIDSPSFKKKEH